MRHTSRVRLFAEDLRPDLPWLSGGFLLTFFSGFGQTYYVALFAGHLKTDLVLTEGEFGTLYTIGTLASAALLTWAGKLADTVSIRLLGAGVIAGLAATCVGMSAVESAWTLALAFFGLRFFGQGMLTHVAMTAMGRWFNRKRGRAVSIAALGLPASEGVLPLLAVAAIGLFGWRGAWIAGAALLVIVALPVFGVLLRHERHPTRGPAAAAEPEQEDARRHWTRGEVLRDPLFYALMPVLLAMPFIITALFINQVPLVELKGWQLAWFAANFPVLAAAHVVGALAAGRLADRFGARRLLTVYLLPMGAGILLLVVAESRLVLPGAMVLLGASLGFASTTHGAVWPELYGARHLGAIRAVTTALAVFATALSPGLVGILMDRGVGLELQLGVMGVYCFAASLWTMLLQGRLERIAAG